MLGREVLVTEKMIMTSNSLTKISESNVIPVVRENSRNPVPTFLKTKLYIDFSSDSDIEFSFDQLLRTILNAPLYKKPDIGKNPFKSIEKATLKKTSDGVREVMRHIVNVFNQSRSKEVTLGSIFYNLPMHRLKFDKYYEEAEELGYLYEDTIYIVITEEGREYAIENGLL